MSEIVKNPFSAQTYEEILQPKSPIENMGIQAGAANSGNPTAPSSNSPAPTNQPTNSPSLQDVISGNILRCISGYVGGAGGWEIRKGLLTSTSIGMATAEGNATYFLWAGNDTPSSAEFNVTHTGVLSATGAIISGTITATAGAIAGFIIIAGYLYSLASGTPTASPNNGIVMASTNPVISVYEGTAKRTEMGYLSAGVFGFKAYATDGTTTVFEISDTQQRIAGFYFTDTVLRSNTLDATSSIFIDSANSLIRAGATSGNYLTLDGANLRLRSSNYVSGMAGAGFTLDPDLFEVGNIAARGLIRTAVFQKNIVSANAGSIVVVPNSDMLDTDMTALDASTVTIKGTTTFAVGDRIRIKDTTDDEWMQVTNVASAPTYVVDRDKNSAYASNSNPTWKKGATVVNYGASGQGGVYITASDTNAPYLSIFTHAGSPWSTITTHLRIGNLNGYLDYVADIYGFAAGSSSSTNANITIETTNGIRLRKGTTNSITLDNSGNITVGEVGVGLANTYISAGAFAIRLNTTNQFGVDTSGNVTIGEVGASKVNTYISAGALSLRLNTTAYFNIDTSGNVLVGQTGASQSNVYISSGAIQLRNNTTPKFSVNSAGSAFFSGAITVGDGATTSGSLSLSHFNTGGDTYISAGTIDTGAWTTTNGFLMGIDDSDSDKFKFYFGTSGDSVDYNVTTANTLTISGDLVAGSVTTDVLVVPISQKLYGENTFIGNYNDGLTQSNPGASTITRSLIRTWLVSDGNTCRLTSGDFIPNSETTWTTNMEFSCVAAVGGNATVGTQDCFVGLMKPQDVPADHISVDRHIGFFITDGKVWASNADGTTQTVTELTTLGTLGNFAEHSYRFVFLTGTSIKFYVDDTLLATHTTNLPTSTTDYPRLYFGMDKTTNRDTLSLANNYIIQYGT